jgi:hypothetical protein
MARATTGEFALLAIYVDGIFDAYTAVNIEQYAMKQSIQLVLTNKYPSWVCDVCGSSLAFEREDRGLRITCTPSPNDNSGLRDSCELCENSDGITCRIDHELYVFPSEKERTSSERLVRGALRRLQDEEDRLQRNGYFHPLTAAELATYREAHPA